MAKKHETKWEIQNVAMSHFQSHIEGKKDRCSLSIIDLLHVSNFKGGYASITEPEASLPTKLKFYEKGLRNIQNEFNGKTLATLNNGEEEVLIELCNDFLALTQKSESHIRGFGPSYASALLAAHFIELIPVLDRRALNGANISVVKDGQGQVKNIAKYYDELINAFSSELRMSSKTTLRELDKEWFSKDI